jgi:uncharacterized protein (TIGR02678 family)
MPGNPPATDPGRSKDSRTISAQQLVARQEEFQAAVRALLSSPLMGPQHADLPLVRRQAEALRDWFARESGWILQVERDVARLYKRPSELTDTTRGLPDYDRRRYVVFCLVCAVLDRADAQITLQVLGERLLLLAADPAFAAQDFRFTLSEQHERRELVQVCRTLLELGVLHRIAGDDDAYIRATSDQADALYDVQRRVLAGILAAVRGPSTWPGAEAPVTLDERLRALVDQHAADSDEGRRTALRFALARRLLDDPVVYTATLDPDTRSYFINQRGAMAARLSEATGLSVEQRAEGLALVDETGTLTDVAMPAEGTDAHVTLLVAEFLASHRAASPDDAPRRDHCTDAAALINGTSADAAARPGTAADLAARPGTAADAVGRLELSADAAGRVRDHDIVDFLRTAKERFGRYWRKSAREPGAERELAAIAIERLGQLKLIAREADGVRTLPALARFKLGEAAILEPAARARGTADAFASQSQ